MINPMELTGKHILITGASSGIGRAAAVLASNLGAKVSLVARQEDKLAETLEALEGEEHHIYAQDISQVETVEPLVRRIAAESGAIDGFVHCAGMGENRPISVSSPNFMKEMMSVSFFAFAEFLHILSKKKFSNVGASLVGISSVAAIRGDKAQGAYAAAKAAMNGLIHPYAKELAARGVRLNTVAFGMIDTGFYQLFLQSGGTDELLKNQYLGVGETKDAANVIAFLLSDASKFITGTTLIADGGFLS